MIEINSAKNAFTVTDVDGNKTESSFTVSDGEYTTDKDGNVLCSGGGLFTIPSLPQFNISENADVQFGSKDKTLQLLGYEVIFHSLSFSRKSLSFSTSFKAGSISNFELRSMPMHWG